jgi:hypothetical protein
MVRVVELSRERIAQPSRDPTMLPADQEDRTGNDQFPVARHDLSCSELVSKRRFRSPPELARDAEETARAEGKTLSAVIQDALRLTRAAQLKREFRAVPRSNDDFGRRQPPRGSAQGPHPGF